MLQILFITLWITLLMHASQVPSLRDKYFFYKEPSRRDILLGSLTLYLASLLLLLGLLLYRAPQDSQMRPWLGHQAPLRGSRQRHTLCFVWQTLLHRVTMQIRWAATWLWMWLGRPPAARSPVWSQTRRTNVASWLGITWLRCTLLHHLSPLQVSITNYLKFTTVCSLL